MDMRVQGHVDEGYVSVDVVDVCEDMCEVTHGWTWGMRMQGHVCGHENT